MIKKITYAEIPWRMEQKGRVRKGREKPLVRGRVPGRLRSKRFKVRSSGLRLNGSSRTGRGGGRNRRRSQMPRERTIQFLRTKEKISEWQGGESCFNLEGGANTSNLGVWSQNPGPN